MISINSDSAASCDSDVTVLRIKKPDRRKKKKSNWQELRELSLLDDGEHLRESPSLVNLVIAVGGNKLVEHEQSREEQGDTLLPLFSWDSSPSDSLSSSDADDGGRKNVKLKKKYKEAKCEKVKDHPEATKGQVKEIKDDQIKAKILSNDQKECEKTESNCDAESTSSIQLDKERTIKSAFRTCFPFLFKKL